MNIIEYTNKFHDIEIKYDFFNQKTKNGILFWDIVRFDVFYAIYYQLAEIETIKVLGQNHNIASTFNLLFKISQYIKFLHHVNFVEYKYFCFVCSRLNTKGNIYIDVISNDILSIIGNKSLVIESYAQKIARYYYPGLFDFGMGLVNRRERFRNKLNNYAQKSHEIARMLNREYGIDIDFNSLISQLVRRYELEYCYYEKLFKKINPVVIFIVQNGIQKGMFAAARKLRIPLVELQHGLIGFIHPAYSYPASISARQLSTLPDYFFTFSSFWAEKINYPVKKIIPMGNSFYATKEIKKENEYEFTVILAKIYAKDLMNFVDKLINNGFAKKICIKLHSDQKNEVDYIKTHYRKNTNVDVVYLERSVKELLSVSDAILVVQSTALYEALHNSVKVMILKIKDYQTHEDVFDDPNVYLIDNIADVSKSLKYEFQKPYVKCYFDDFDKNRFLNFLNKFN